MPSNLRLWEAVSAADVLLLLPLTTEERETVLDIKGKLLLILTSTL